MALYIGPEIIAKSANYCTAKNKRLMGIDDIGRRIPSPDIATITDIGLSSKKALGRNGDQGVAYFRDFEERVIALDFIEAGLPEYALDWLIKEQRYTSKRKGGILWAPHEEVLGMGMQVLSKKYSEERVQTFKKRFGIDEICESVIRRFPDRRRKG